MSCMEYKTVIRAKIPLITKNWNEAYLYFRDKIGEPYEIYHNKEEEVDYFRYDKDHKFVPICDYCGNFRQWYVDHVIHHSYDGDVKINEYPSIEETNTIAKELAEIFNIDSNNDVKLVQYSWYNGVDEPAYFD